MTIGDSTLVRARFGGFEMDVRSGELRRSGSKIALQEQPFRLLQLLAERAGEVVDRDEMRARLWPSEFVDFDHSLNAAIHKVRLALDDDADNPRFVETVARHGYRFIAPVEWEEAPSATVDKPAGRPDTSPDDPPVAWRIRRLLLGLGGVLALVAVAALLIDRARRPPAAAGVDAVAVMPFSTADASIEYLGDGITEALIDNLSRLPRLRVMARTSVFRYKGAAIDVQRVGRELNVTGVVMGELQRRGDSYRVHVELVDARNGAQIWGRRYDALATDLPSIHDRIARDLSSELREEGAGGPRLHRGRPPASPVAWELYLKGRYSVEKRTKEGVTAAIDYFSRAIAADPKFAAAHAGLASAWGVASYYGFAPREESNRRCQEAATAALRIDPTDSDALVNLGATDFRSAWQWNRSENELRRAIASNPNNAAAHNLYAQLLRSERRFDEALEQADLAYHLDPLSIPVNWSGCMNRWFAGRYDEAIAFSRRVANLDQRFFYSWCAMESHMALKQFDQAVADIENEVTPSWGCETGPALAAAWRAGGEQGLLEERLKLRLDCWNRGNGDPVAVAEAYAQLGRQDEAFSWLERGYEARSLHLADVYASPTFQSLRSDPRFDELTRRMGLPPERDESDGPADAVIR